MLKLRFKNNKHNAVWLVEPKVVIGCHSGCDLVLDDPQVEARHLEILVEHEVIELRPLVASKVLSLNGQTVDDTVARPLKVNDSFTIAGVELEVIDPKVERGPAPTVTRLNETSGWALKANHSALANRMFALKSEMVVGRSKECDITLAAAHLSRRHAMLLVKNGLLYVKDLGSSNGTYVNGKRIVEARVKRGDELRFDSLSFGVIGPADELDKTTVRSAPNPAPVKPALKSRAAVKAPQVKAVPLGSSVETIQPSSSGGSKGVVALGVIVLVASAGVYLAISQGLFPL